MFDGDFRSKNKISLRGASKQTANSKETLQLAKKLRLERQKEREKIQNVSTIQHFFRASKQLKIIKTQKRSEMSEYFEHYEQTQTFPNNFYRLFIFSSFYDRKYVQEDYKTLQRILHLSNEEFFIQQSDRNEIQFLNQNFTLISKVIYFLIDFMDLEVLSTTNNLLETIFLKFHQQKEITLLLLCKLIKNCQIFSILGKLLTLPKGDEIIYSEVERLFFNILYITRTYLENNSNNQNNFNQKTIQEIKSIKELIPTEIISKIFVISDVFMLLSERNIAEFVELLSSPIYTYIVNLSYEMQSLSIILNTLQFAKILNSPSLILNLTSIFDPKLDSLLHRKITIEEDWDDDSDDEGDKPQDKEEFLLIEQFNQLITASQLSDLVTYIFKSKQMNENITLFCKLCYSVYEKYERSLGTPMINNLSFSTPFVTLLWRIAFTSILPSFDERISATLPFTMDMNAILNLFCLSCSCILAAMDDEEFYSEKTFTTKEWYDIFLFFKKIIVSQYEQRYLSRDPKTYNTVPLVRLIRNLYDFETKSFTGEKGTWVSETMTRLYDKCSVEYKNEIIRDIPFLLSLRKRFEIFQTLVQLNKDESYMYPHKVFRIRRDDVFNDAFVNFSSLSSDDWFRKIRINFINSEGLEEAGIDGGGLFKEFITNLLELSFSTEFGLFKYSESKELYPNPDCHLPQYSMADVYHFLGKVLAKGIMESILVHLYFAKFFISKILGNKRFKINDLRYLDSQLYHNLMKLKNYPGNVEDDFCLTFSITIEESSSRKKEIDLVPNGRNITVNNDNRFRYIHLVSKYWLKRQIQVQSQAFLSGFHSIIPAAWIRIFNEEELQLLISGVPDINLEDLRLNTNYTNGYSDEHETIIYFWKALESFDPVLRMKFLKFVTGTVRSPLLGFANLSPKFGIHQAISDTNRLPSASTCFNQLRLPNYSSYEILREKLLQAINAEAGFDLS